MQVGALFPAGCAGSLPTPSVSLRGFGVLTGTGLPPFGAVEAVQKILVSTAAELQPPLAASLEDAVRRRAHFLFAAWQAAARRQLQPLQPRRQLQPLDLGDDAGLVLLSEGEAVVVCEANFSEAMRHAVWAPRRLPFASCPRTTTGGEGERSAQSGGSCGSGGGASAIRLSDGTFARRHSGCRERRRASGAGRALGLDVRLQGADERRGMRESVAALSPCLAVGTGGIAIAGGILQGCAVDSRQ